MVTCQKLRLVRTLRAALALAVLPAPAAAASEPPASTEHSVPTAAAFPLETQPAEAAAAAPATRADEAQPAHAEPVPAQPRLHHAPLSVEPPHERLLFRASIDHPELVKRALLIVRTPGRSDVHEIEFKRSLEAPYVAEIPADQVLPGTLAYAIELETLDGTRAPVFASREQLHELQITDDLDEVREKALLARLGGRRSVFFTSADYVSFGKSTAEASSGGTADVRDGYFRVEGGYTYRPLTVVTEFSLRIGVVRGRSPVALSESQAPGTAPNDRFKVGLNYGAPSVRFRVVDILHVEAEFLTSVTEVGFALGAGGAVLFGDPYGSKLTLGFESIYVFGNRFYSRVDIVAAPRVTVSPVVEVTNMPHADDYGVRLFGEVSVDAGAGFGIAARGGYQARVFTEGGPSAGLTLRYAF
jgi:hypothetical protein